MKQKLNEGGESEKREGGGYVGKCLVKVQGVGEGEGEDQVTMEKLKVLPLHYRSALICVIIGRKYVPSMGL